MVNMPDNGNYRRPRLRYGIGFWHIGLRLFVLGDRLLRLYYGAFFLIAQLVRRLAALKGLGVHPDVVARIEGGEYHAVAFLVHQSRRVALVAALASVRKGVKAHHADAGDAAAQ